MMSRDQRKSWKYNDVDTGYAWIVVIGCFVMYVFMSGSFKAYGVLYTEMVDYYSTGYGNTAWINTIALILMFCLGPVANLLCKMYSFRCVTMIGGVLLGLGYFLSGFVTRMEYMYLTFISVGLGYGFTFAPCFTILRYHFDKRRAFANGITVSGSGFGAIGLSFLNKFLIEQYSLPGTFWIIGAVLSNVCVAACLFRQPKYLVEERNKTRADRSNSDVDNIENGQSHTRTNEEYCVRNNNKRRPCGELDLRFSLYKNVVFTLYVVSFICCTFAYIGSLILVPANVKTLGYDTTHVALSVTIFGGVEAVARIFMGWFADLNLIQRKYIYALNMFIGAIFSLLAPFFENFTFISIYAAVAAIFPGSYFSLMSVLIIDAVDLEDFSPAFGLLTLSMAVGTIPSQPVVGWLYDLYGNWHSSFIVTGCVYVLAGVIVLVEPVVVRCCSKTNNKETTSPENQPQRQNDDNSTDFA